MQSYVFCVQRKLPASLLNNSWWLLNYFEIKTSIWHTLKKVSCFKREFLKTYVCEFSFISKWQWHSLKTRSNVCGGSCMKEKCGDREPVFEVWYPVPLLLHPWASPSAPGPPAADVLSSCLVLWRRHRLSLPESFTKTDSSHFLKWLTFPWNSEIRSAVWNLSKWILTVSWKPGRGEPGPLKCKRKSSEPEKGTKWEVREAGSFGVRWEMVTFYIADLGELF